MHRFFVTRIEGDQALLGADEAAHALKVLRLKAGDEVHAMDGAGLKWRARIASIGAGGVRIELTEALDPCESAAKITLYQGLPKAEKLELIAQKAVELGAFRIVPVVMARSVARPGEREILRKRERIERIVLEAVKQCGRARVPCVEQALDFDRARGDMRERELLVMPWEEARGVTMKQIGGRHPGARDIGVVIGPEGGIERAEADAVCALGGHAVTLGPRILRCETAAIIAVALAQQLWGDI